MSAVSMAWLLHKGACRIVGLNTTERIEAVAEAFHIRLTDENVRCWRSLIGHCIQPI
jgi:diketogulonate reductase-like aldo/keto reductase